MMKVTIAVAGKMCGMESHCGAFTTGAGVATLCFGNGRSQPGNSISKSSPAVRGMLKGIQFRRRTGSLIDSETV
jgi:hypothetical protein